MNDINGVSRRDFLKAAGMAVAVSAMLPQQLFAKKSAKKPNVIFILTDDQGYGDLACYGNELIKTPNLDKLYSESTRLNNFHVSPCCSPSRAQLMTGRHPNRTGVWHTVAGRSLLHKDEVTMADAFKANGYKTAIFGKWHLGDNYPYRPQDRGFDEVLIHGGGGVGNISDYWANNYFDDTYFHNGQPQKYEGYCTDVWFNEAMKFIETNKDRPFFCYISTNAPHLPYVVGDEYYDLYKDLPLEESMAKFYGMITNIDDNTAKLRNKLKQLGIEEDTILVFVGDNGTARGSYSTDRSKYSYNAGMRGSKGTEYEGGHRVMLFIRWPGGGLSKGKDIDQLTAGFDVLPTLIDLCNIKRPKGPRLDGISLVPLLKDQTRNWPDRTLIVDNQRVTYPVPWRRTSVMNGKWRLVNNTELYDIEKDPSQKNNIIEKHPKIVKKLRKDYDKWWASLSDSFNRDYEITIGSDKENPSVLTAHDLNGAAIWNQDQILAANRADGYWAVNVEKSGSYEFVLRRWPKEVDVPITASIPVPSKLKTLTYYARGLDYAIINDRSKTIEATYARLKIADIDVSKPFSEKDNEVKFKVRLRSGSTRLQTWFVNGANDGDSTGAYYVYVRRL